MFRYIFTLLIGLLFSTGIFGQNETKISVEVSKRQVRAGELFEVKFLVENSQNGKFVPPNWSAAKFFPQGSSQSSSFSFSNGNAQSTATYKYQLMARDTGRLEIPAAVLKTGGKDLQTQPQEIVVLPGNGDAVSIPGEKEPLTPSQERQEAKKKIKTVRL